MHTGRPCRAKTKRGRPCRSAAGDSGYCAVHMPGFRPFRPSKPGPRTYGQRSYDARRAARKALLADQIAALYEGGTPRREIARIIERSTATVEWHCIRLRREARIGRRYEPISLANETAHDVARLWRDGHSVREIGSWFAWTETRTRSVIFRLRAMGLDLPKRGEREAELAALVKAQHMELAMRERATRDPQHWIAASLDAPLTEDGFTILDTLADQDDVLAEMGQPA